MRGGDIAIGAAGALLILALCVAAGRVYGPRRWQRTLWAFRVPADDRPKIIIETIEGEETGLYRRPTAGLGAVTAVAQLATALNDSRSGLVRRASRSLQHPIELAFSSENQADTWCSEADTVVVGGPKSNEISAEVLRAFGCQPPGNDRVGEEDLLRLTKALRPADGGTADGLGVATKGNSLFWFGAKYAGNVRVLSNPPPGTTGYHGFDYGVVLRLPSPTASRRTVVVFGSQTFGVDAAAAWLVQLRTSSAVGARRIRKTMAKHRNVAVLVRADVIDGVLGELSLEDVVVLPDRLEPRHWQ